MVAVRTPVCELLGIEQPIVQAPMSALTELAAAVSNAGALGMLALTWSTPAGDVVRETAALTDRPFGGNLILDSDQHRRLDEALEAGLRIVSLFWGDPAGYVEQVHEAGGVVLHTVGSAEEARRAVASGVDVIVAQGWEAEGDGSYDFCFIRRAGERLLLNITQTDPHRPPSAGHAFHAGQGSVK